jgi:peptidoglycan/xylan/chitin deacetylase (PgdA/CDA1 family)
MKATHKLLLGLLGSSTPSSVVLPQYLETDRGTIYESFEDVEAFSSVSQGTIELNTTPGEFIHGAASIKATNTLGYNVVAFRQASLPLPCPPLRTRLYFYVHDTSTLKSVRLIMSMDVGDAYIEPANAINTWRNGWNALDAMPDKWSFSGTSQFGSVITGIKIYVFPTDTSTVTSVSFDQLVIGITNPAAIFLSFDDAVSSVHSLAFPVMAAHGVRGTVYVNSSTVGTNNYMTWEQLHELEDAGWDMANHTATHINLSTASLEDAVADITACTNALDAAGFPRASRHLAYPFGARNTEACVQAGMFTARAINSGFLPVVLDEQQANRWSLPAYALGTGITTEMALEQIDKAIAGPYVLPMYLHGLHTGSPGYNWNLDSFVSMIEYIAARRMPCLTISEIYSAWSGPVTIPLSHR